MKKAPFRFSAAQPGEPIVFGSARPGYADQNVQAWIDWMQHQDIKRVCCLLAPDQLDRYSHLLEAYRQAFGQDQVNWVPVKDFHLIDRDDLTQKILPFLAASEQRGERVVVHCAGGIGRTGQVMTAWLVLRRGIPIQTAIEAVKKTGRNPYEFALAGILKGKNPLTEKKQFDRLLENLLENA